MELGPPKLITFWIATILAILGVLGMVVPSLGLSGLAFWILAIGFVILAAGALFESL